MSRVEYIVKLRVLTDAGFWDVTTQRIKGTFVILRYRALLFYWGESTVMSWQHIAVECIVTRFCMERFTSFMYAIVHSRPRPKPFPSPYYTNLILTVLYCTCKSCVRTGFTSIWIFRNFGYHYLQQRPLNLQRVLASDDVSKFTIFSWDLTIPVFQRQRDPTIIIDMDSNTFRNDLNNEAQFVVRALGYSSVARAVN